MERCLSICQMHILLVLTRESAIDEGGPSVRSSHSRCDGVLLARGHSFAIRVFGGRVFAVHGSCILPIPFQRFAIMNYLLNLFQNVFDNGIFQKRSTNRTRVMTFINRLNIPFLALMGTSHRSLFTRSHGGPSFIESPGGERRRADSLQSPRHRQRNRPVVSLSSSHSDTSSCVSGSPTSTCLACTRRRGVCSAAATQRFSSFSPASPL